MGRVTAWISKFQHLFIMETYALNLASTQISFVNSDKTPKLSLPQFLYLQTENKMKKNVNRVIKGYK